MTSTAADDLENTISMGGVDAGAIYALVSYNH